MSQSLSPPEKRTLTALDRLLRRAAVRASIDAAIGPLERRLPPDTGAQMAWETVPLSLHHPGLAGTLRWSWLFILRSGAVTGAERHPTTHQRTQAHRRASDLTTIR